MKKEENRKGNRWNLSNAVVLFIFALYPLVVRLAFVKTSHSELILYGTENVNDSFAYMRSKILFVIAIIGFLNLIFNGIISRRKRHLELIDYTIGGLFLLITCSFVFSEYRTAAWRGAIDHFEGYYVWIAYLMLFMTVYHTKFNFETLKRILSVWIISSCVISFIGILQNQGVNLLDAGFMMKLIVPEKIRAMSDHFFLMEYGFAYSTLGNPNYVGSYTVLVLPVIIGLFNSTKNIVGKVAFAFALVINTWFMIVSFSEAGVVAAVFGVIYITVYRTVPSIKSTVEEWMMPLLFIACIFVFNRFNIVSLMESNTFWPLVLMSAVLAIVCALLSKYVKTKKITIILGLTIVSLGAVLISTLYSTEDVIEYRANIHIEQVVLENNLLKIGFVDQQNDRVDSELYYDDELEMKVNEKVYSINSDVSEFSFETYPENILNMELEQKEGYKKITFSAFNQSFAIRDKNLYYVNGAGFLIDKVNSASKFNLFKDESIGSKRGYIWNRTFPMLWNTILIGKGSDTYVLGFPQYDIAGKWNVQMNPEMIVDKPHDAYLHFWYSHGLLALFLWLAVIGRILLSYFSKSRLEQVEDDGRALYDGVQAAILGFLLVSFFNDSVVYVTPLFVVLLGMLGSKTRMGLNLSEKTQ